MGVPQNGWFRVENPIKKWVPTFQETFIKYDIASSYKSIGHLAAKTKMLVWWMLIAHIHKWYHRVLGKKKVNIKPHFVSSINIELWYQEKGVDLSNLWPTRRVLSKLPLHNHSVPGCHLDNSRDESRIVSRLLFEYTSLLTLVYCACSNPQHAVYVWIYFANSILWSRIASLFLRWDCLEIQRIIWGFP